MNNCLELFLSNMNKKGKVLELGTKRWGPNPTHHKDMWPEAFHLGVDFIDGIDVDVVADVQELSKYFKPNSIDAIFSASTFEHIRKPWLASEEILKVLKPNGVAFIQSHHTFPYHSYPADLWRFTPEAWKVLFDGASEIITASEYPCKIIPPESVKVWDSNAPAFLNTVCYVRK